MIINWLSEIVIWDGAMSWLFYRYSLLLCSFSVPLVRFSILNLLLRWTSKPSNSGTPLLRCLGELSAEHPFVITVVTYLVECANLLFCVHLCRKGQSSFPLNQMTKASSSSYPGLCIVVVLWSSEYSVFFFWYFLWNKQLYIHKLSVLALWGNAEVWGKYI